LKDEDEAEKLTRLRGWERFCRRQARATAEGDGCGSRL